MGQGTSRELPDPVDIKNVAQIPMGVIFLIQACIVFAFGIVGFTLGKSNIFSIGLATFSAYLWMFFIYFLVFSGNSPDKIFGQIFVIFFTILVNFSMQTKD